MKNLHFYIQSVMLILALSIAVLIPLEDNFMFPVLYLKFFLGAYQLGMSCLLIFKLSYKPLLLKLHFFGSLSYFGLLFLVAQIDFSWKEAALWTNTISVLPWAFAIPFLVAMDEMERFRHYRL